MYDPILQSERYFESANVSGTDFPGELTRGIHSRQVQTVLDVGCGEGNVTRFIGDKLEASVVGIEPSKKVSDELNRKWQAFDNLRFTFGSVWSLPFESGEFDLVVAKGILPWVEPKFLVDSLAELARVSSELILLWDKYASEDYKTPYSHSEGAFTYRRDVLPFFMLTGDWKVLEEDFWVMRDGQFSEVAKTEFLPLIGNRLSWDGYRRLVLKRSTSDTYPTLLRQDFIS